MVGVVEQGETLKIKAHGGDPLNNQGLGIWRRHFKIRDQGYGHFSQPTPTTKYYIMHGDL